MTDPDPAAEPTTRAPEPRPWGRGDVLALLAWSAAVLVIFGKAATLREAFFYFDVTEINFPYRAFLADQIRTGRFARWHPGLYCGLPLYSESQAGYWHPLKYLLYTWLPAWQAFNLDTILSIWLTGLASYGWLRRHAGPEGALTGAAIVGLGGFTWAHLIHTSMINALPSVPLAFWALEASWASGRLRGAALGGVALAFQVFAGHLQDTLLTGFALGVYALCRAAGARSWRERTFVLTATAALLVMGIAAAAVQWVPSKELLDRSPRAGGLSYSDQAYGSWHPELLPSLLVREAYGTLPRDTDWMDGYYPYHEMNAYLGGIALALAIVGAAASRDRWVSGWIVLGTLGALLMLGRYTVLFDALRSVPILGSSRIPVRYHLWVTMAVAALAATGVDRLSRPGKVRLGPALGVLGVLMALSAALLVYIYIPFWNDPRNWSNPRLVPRSRWLLEQLLGSTARTAALAGLALWLAARSAREHDARRRRLLAAALPILILADLGGAHFWDAPTVPPSYWTDPPPAVTLIKADPARGRVLGVRSQAARPGFASTPIDFFPTRDALAWSLPPVWGLASAWGETPIHDTRVDNFADASAAARLDVEGVSHLLFGRGPVPPRPIPSERAGSATLLRNPGALPRARLLGRPVYAADRASATRALRALDPRERLVVEDPDRPLPADASPAGTATITRDEPERVDVTTDCPSASYLFLADTFDPGWRATVDGRPAPIRPAQVAFRAVYLPPGRHSVAFRYRPAGWDLGLAISGLGVLAIAFCLAWPGRFAPRADLAGPSTWPPRWPWIAAGLVTLVLAGSIIRIGPGGSVGLQRRWSDSVHRFTWGPVIDPVLRP